MVPAVRASLPTTTSTAAGGSGRVAMSIVPWNGSAQAAAYARS